jgi:hypothetical protein
VEASQPLAAYAQALAHDDDAGPAHDDHSGPLHSICHGHSSDTVVGQEFRLPSEDARSASFLAVPLLTPLLLVPSARQLAIGANWRLRPSPRSYFAFHHRTARLLI